ncbi:MAG: DUF2231 domain-containing protein [Sphaerobacter sp.]|nr:DUF2231 domain-containing protein [Sphaerobacter sp.]
MESHAKAFGHPIHPMLIVFPLGLLATSLVFDIIYLFTDNGKWSEIAYWLIAAGIIGGLLAAPFGLLDWLAIPNDTRAKRVGLYHGAGNAVILILFAISWLLRRDDPLEPGAWPIILSAVGVGLALITGWLGGELVDRLRVGVDDEAQLNASSSLTAERPPTPGGRARA